MTKMVQTSAFEKEFEDRLIGRSAVFVRREDDWEIRFDKSLSLCVRFWRLRDKAKIVVTSEDDGHQFGLPERVDAEARANDALTGATTIRLEMNSITADLLIKMSNGAEIDVLTTSMGYESWQTYENGECFAAGGNGGLI